MTDQAHKASKKYWCGVSKGPVGLYDSATVLILRLAHDTSCLSPRGKNHVSYLGTGNLCSTLLGTKNTIHYF